MRRCLLIVLVGFAACAWGTPAHAFTGLNSTPILGPATGARGAASPYPSEITVSGEIGSFAGASVTLHGVTTTAAADLDVMLVSPSGERILLASDPGGSGSLSNATLTFADNSSPLPNSSFSSGTYRPTDIDPSPSTCSDTTTANDDDFGAPAPGPGPNPSGDYPMQAAFDRSGLNGTWKLYVMDDCGRDTVAINGGWTLNLQALPGQGVAVPATGTSGPASVYPVEVPISGQGTRVTKVTADLQGPVHTHPDDLDILLVGPTGASTMLMSDAGGDNLLATDDGDVFFSDGDPPVPDSGQIQTDGHYRPTDYDAGDGDPFPSPAPPGPYPASTSVFDGTDPNGTWRFFMVDDAAGDVGGLQGVKLSIQATTPGGQSVTTSQQVRPSGVPPKDPADVFPPKIRVITAKDLKTHKLVKDGALGISVVTNEAALVAAQAVVGAGDAKALGLPPNGKAFTSSTKKATPAIVARGSARARKAGRVAVKLKLTTKARRALRKTDGSVHLQLRTRVTDKAGNRRLVKSSVTLKP